MKRTQQWWAQLTSNERAELMFLEKGAHYYGRSGGYLPEGYRDCGGCGMITSGRLCTGCSNRIEELKAIAAGGPRPVIVNLYEEDGA